MIRIISVLFWAAALATGSFGRDIFNRAEYRRNFDKTLTVQSGERVSIEHKFGDVVIRTHPQQEVTIHAEIRVSAEQ